EVAVRVRMAGVLDRLRQGLQKYLKETKKLAPELRRERQALVKQLRADRRQQYDLAAEVLERYIPRDPENPALRFRLASLLFEAKRYRAAGIQARQARELDERAPARRTLTDRQRGQLKKWLGPNPPG